MYKGNGRANAAMINSFTNGSASYLPYRESVLTWLLKESLGGNAKTAMLATVNASNNYLDETLCTLRYAAKTACIKNLAHLNRNFKQKYINDFGEETEMSLILPPMSANIALDNRNTKMRDAQLEATIRIMEEEWKEKLEEAERLKQKEINDLEKSLIVLYENETRAQNCCLINLNEDPSLSEKLIYLLKSSDSKTSSSTAEAVETLVGSDKNMVNIHLTGPLIAQIHSKIWKKHQDNNYYIEHCDKNYVTYLNGEVIEQRKEMRLNHGDRIIFGGSHFFRFNNPASNKQTANKSASAPDNNHFKDYQFAKNEIERKQNELIQEKLNEALSKCKKDGDLKMQELKEAYEKDLELIVIFKLKKKYLFYHAINP
jgi:kinesin family member 14